MTAPRLLIAGIGNIFLGDDAFGVEVARRLAQRDLPAAVRVVDFGIRGLDLSFALLESYESVILVDATSRGEPPGTLYVIEPEFQPGPAHEADGASSSGDHAPDPHELMIETHNMDPAKVLRLAAAMGSPVQRVLLVGCEPRPLDDADTMQMSEAAQSAVERALPLIESLITELLQGGNANECEPAKNHASQDRRR